MNPTRLLLGVFVCLLTVSALGAGEFDSRGVEPDTPLRFTYGGNDFRALPAERVGESRTTSETASEQAAEGDRFRRGAVTTNISEQIDRATGLKITTETVTYGDFPEVVERVVWFENTSDKNTSNLRDILAADVTFQTGEEPTLWHGIGENNDPKLNYSYTLEPLAPDAPKEFSPREAYPSYYAFPYFRLKGHARSFIVAIGWTGQWSAAFTADGRGGVHFTAGQRTTDLYLKPGEKIRTPRITIFSCAPDADLVNRWRSWLRTYILPRQNGRVIPAKLILDAHAGGELYKDITEEQQIDTIRRVRAKGVEIDGLWIDAGWYLRKGSPKIPNIGYWFRAGDWTPDPERFPRGMKPLADELGPEADFTLWYEPERIHRDAATFPEYKKYVVPDCEIVESYRMNMASPETVEFLSNLIGGSLRENGVRIYRQDSNGAGPGPFLESLEKSDPNFSDRKGMAENLYVQGYLTFWKNLKAMNPELVFDTCASGGRRNDLDTLRMGAVPLHYSDVGYADFIEKQRYHDMLDQWFIYYKNIDSHDWDGAKKEYDTYKATIDFAPFWTLSPLFLDNDTPTNRRYIARFRTVGELMVTGDYYLLRGGFSTDSWTVAEFFDADAGDGFLRVVRNPENTEPSVTVRLRGLDAAKRYKIENLDTDETSEATGRDLLEMGLALSLEARGGQIVRFTEIR